MKTNSKIQVLNFRKPSRMIVIAVVVLAILGAGLAVSKASEIELPRADDILSVTMNHYSEYLPVGEVVITDKIEIGNILYSLSGARKTLKKSIQDYPANDNYLDVRLSLAGQTRTLYLYTDGADYIEEPYVGIYRAKSKCNYLYSVYAAYGDAGGTPSNPNTYLPQIMIDHTLYYLSGRNNPVIEIAESDFLGRILSTVPLTHIPTENDQANIDVKGCPYAKYENGIVVLWKGEWTLFVTYEELLSNSETDTANLGGKPMTLEDVRVLAAKGAALSYADLEIFQAEPVLTGLYYLNFVVDGGAYRLHTLGSPPDDLWYAKLLERKQDGSYEIMINDIRNRIDFSVRYIRTDGYANGAEYPMVSVINTKDDLERYYNEFKDIYDFASRAQVDSDAAIGFADEMEKYTDDFFKNNYLIIVMLEEGSGSVRHKVDRIEENGDIVISRLLPGIGTADMAEWSIIIGLNNLFNPEGFSVILTDVPAS